MYMNFTLCPMHYVYNTPTPDHRRRQAAVTGDANAEKRTSSARSISAALCRTVSHKGHSTSTTTSTTIATDDILLASSVSDRILIPGCGTAYDNTVPHEHRSTTNTSVPSRSHNVSRGTDLTRAHSNATTTTTTTTTTTATATATTAVNRINHSNRSPHKSPYFSVSSSPSPSSSTAEALPPIPIHRHPQHLYDRFRNAATVPRDSQLSDIIEARFIGL